MRAVERMNEGESPRAVAAAMGMHRSWAYKCRASAQDRGMESLRSTRASGRPRRLTAAQEREVFSWIQGQRPDQHGVEHGLWTRQIVQGLLRTRFDVTMSLASVSALFARLGLSVHHPLAQLEARDPVLARRWRNETYPALLAQARRDEAEVLFWDEFLLPRPASGPAAPGEPRPAVCVASAKGAFWFAGGEVGLDGDSFVARLRQFLDGRARPVHLVLEDTPARQAPEVRQYVRSLRGAVSLHFLPLAETA